MNQGKLITKLQSGPSIFVMIISWLALHCRSHMAEEEPLASCDVHWTLELKDCQTVSHMCLHLGRLCGWRNLPTAAVWYVCRTEDETKVNILVAASGPGLLLLLFVYGRINDSELHQYGLCLTEQCWLKQVWSLWWWKWRLRVWGCEPDAQHTHVPKCHV